MTSARYTVGPSIIASIIGVVLVLVVCLRGFLVWYLHHQIDALHLYVIVAVFVCVAFIVYLQLIMAREIIVHPDDEIEFVASARRVRLQAREIRSVRWLFGYPSVRGSILVVRHNSGAVYLATTLARVHNFLTDLERANPSVRLPTYR